jgi:hypothetical protein
MSKRSWLYLTLTITTDMTVRSSQQTYYSQQHSGADGSINDFTVGLGVFKSKLIDASSSIKD